MKFVVVVNPDSHLYVVNLFKKVAFDSDVDAQKAISEIVSYVNGVRELCKYPSFRPVNRMSEIAKQFDDISDSAARARAITAACKEYYDIAEDDYCDKRDAELLTRFREAGVSDDVFELLKKVEFVFLTNYIKHEDFAVVPIEDGLTDLVGESLFRAMTTLVDVKDNDDEDEE